MSSNASEWILEFRAYEDTWHRSGYDYGGIDPDGVTGRDPVSRAIWLRTAHQKWPGMKYRFRDTRSGEVEMLDEHGNIGVSFIATESEDAPPTEQPAPHGTGREILPLVIADLVKRSERGTAKYGEPLRANNGRSALQDAYEELLDMCQYLRQAIEEQK